MVALPTTVHFHKFHENRNQTKIYIATSFDHDKMLQKSKKTLHLLEHVKAIVIS